MRSSDLTEFSGMLDTVCDMLSRGKYTPTGTNTAMWFRALANHDIAAVRSGFDAHVKDPERGRFVPVPADIIAAIKGHASDDGRPGPEEAWAQSLPGVDEQQTVVWTDEMATAWCIALPVLDGGDEVGARMAFRETYARLVDVARRANRPANWTASLGFDKSLQQQALCRAAELNRLPAPEVVVLPAPEKSLEMLSMLAPTGVREKLRELRNLLANRNDGPSHDQLERERTVALQDETRSKVAAYMLEKSV